MIDPEFLAAIRRIEQAPRDQWFRVFQDEVAGLITKVHSKTETKEIISLLLQTWRRKNAVREYTDAQFENIISAAQLAKSKTNGSNGTIIAQSHEPEPTPPKIDANDLQREHGADGVPQDVRQKRQRWSARKWRGRRADAKSGKAGQIRQCNRYCARRHQNSQSASNYDIPTAQVHRAGVDR
jgi:hypothetical protein